MYIYILNKTHHIHTWVLWCIYLYIYIYLCVCVDINKYIYIHITLYYIHIYLHRSYANVQRKMAAVQLPSVRAHLPLRIGQAFVLAMSNCRGETRRGHSGNPHRGRIAGDGHVVERWWVCRRCAFTISMDWFKGKSTGKPRFLPSNLMGFPVIFFRLKFPHHPILWLYNYRK